MNRHDESNVLYSFHWQKLVFLQPVEVIAAKNSDLTGAFYFSMSEIKWPWRDLKKEATTHYSEGCPAYRPRKKSVKVNYSKTG